MPDASTGENRRRSAIELVALGAALVPFVVAVVRAGVQRWMPIGDAAYFTVRSRDVLTAHHPLLGAWSSGSSVVGVPVNNLGPLQLDLLAPFTKPWPYLGTGIGSAMINATSILVIWLVARRLLRSAVVVVVMVGTLVYLSTLGLSWLIDARQQYAMVLPLLALLWLSAGMWAGVGFAVPVGVATASLIAQTHFTFAYQTLIIGAAGIAGYVAATWRGAGARGVLRIGLWSVGVVLVCWIQPLWDHLFGTGNLGNAVGSAADRAGAGFENGVQILASGSLTPPFWLPGSMDGFLVPRHAISYGVSVVVVAAWLVAAAAVTWIGARHGSLVTRSLGTAAIVALVGGLVAATRIPVSSFGLTPQNYYWAWSLGAFVTIALLAGVLSLPAVVSRLRRWPGRWRRAALVGAGLAALAVAVWPRYPVESVAVDEVEADRVARPLRRQLEQAFAAGLVDDVVEVDLGRAFFGNDYPFVILAELQRAGIEFRFVPEVRGEPNTNLKRFGTSRCAGGGQFQRLLIIPGRDPRLDPGSQVVAEVVGIGDDELDEYRLLQDRFGELLRAGVVTVDPGVTSVFSADPDVAKLREVQATGGMAAAGLGRSLRLWLDWGLVDVPLAERTAFDRWVALEHRSVFDYQTVVVENPIPSEGAC